MQVRIYPFQIVLLSLWSVLAFGEAAASRESSVGT